MHNEMVLMTNDLKLFLSPVLYVIILRLLIAHGAMGRRIDPSWGEPIELFLVPASAPRLV